MAANNFLDEFRTQIMTILPELGGNIEPMFNQSSTLPRACYRVTNAEAIDACLDGTHGDRDYELQLDIFHNDLDEAWNMIELCRTNLENTVLEDWGDFTAVDIFDCKTLLGGETSLNGSNQTIYHATLLLTVTVRG